VLPRGLGRGQVNFPSRNSCLSLGASSAGRRRACVLFGVSFRGGYSPTGLPGDKAWLAFPPTGCGWLGVLSHLVSGPFPATRRHRERRCQLHPLPPFHLVASGHTRRPAPKPSLSFPERTWRQRWPWWWPCVSWPARHLRERACPRGPPPLAPWISRKHQRSVQRSSTSFHCEPRTF